MYVLESLKFSVLVVVFSENELTFFLSAYSYLEVGILYYRSRVHCVFYLLCVLIVEGLKL